MKKIPVTETEEGKTNDIAPAAENAHEDDADGLRLTTAGIELCKSLQHRVAADAQAAKIVQQRDESLQSDAA